ncbi:AAA family ATPase [Sorangium sp. So ce1036]|uniref:AAA family ATPase n=1 Tax=Sorangium sp. So ce1036 TaxID=3133328 RepID=UPI003F098B1E
MVEHRPNLYLDAIEVSGLRGIDSGDATGNGPALALGALEQVTIIAAPNGLGKTSLVDGLRLCLTGELQRHGRPLSFDELRHRPLEPRSVKSPVRLRACFKESFARQEQNLASTNLDLLLEAHSNSTFESGRERAASSARDLLARDQALSPASVKALFNIAHFLPQGWGDRLIDMDPKDGMSTLTQALGLATLNKALEEIKGTTLFGRAIADRVKRLKDELTRANAEQQEWNERVRAWNEARKQAEIAGTEDARTLQADLMVLAEEMGVPREAWPTALAVVTALESALARRVQEIETLEARRAVAADLVDCWNSAKETERKQSSAATEAARDLAQARDALKGAEEDVRRAERSQARAVLPRLRYAADTASARLTEATTHARYLEDAARRAALEALAHQADAAAAAIAEVDQARAGSHIEILSKASCDADAEILRAQDVLNAATALRDERVREAGTLLDLLRSIRSHLTAHAFDALQATECPVCNSSFSGAALLARLDRAILAQSTPDLEPLDREVTTAERCVDEAMRQRDSARAALRAAQGRLADLDRTVDEAQQTLVGVRRQVGLFVEEPIALSSEIRSLARSLPDPAELGGSTALALRRSEAEVAVSAAGAALDTARALLDEAISKTGAPQNPAESEVPAPSEATADEALAQARAIREAAARRAADAESNYTTQQAALIRLQRTLDDVGARWRMQKLPGEPCADAVEALEQRVTVARARLDTHRAALAATKPRIDAFGAGTELARAERELRTARAVRAEGAPPRGAGPDPGSFSTWVERMTGWLSERAEAAHEAHQEGERREKAISTMRANLAGGIRSLHDGLLPRIERPRDAFLKALAPGLPWRPSAQRNRQGLTHGIHYGAMEVTDGPSPLATALSEGEQNAVALAYLFALHVTLGGWSRWPGLVLDDPFQSADVVRVAALLDVLRGLVLHRGTQVVLTTHNLDKADWCARRMRNAGIGTALFHLHRGVTGVRAERRRLG